ncbi:MAG: hypothetical protein ACYC2H_04750 [Thermoplasmatota archaeon]
MLGSLVSSMSQRMIRLATTTLMVSGAGLAGYSYYIDQQAAATGTTGYLTFFREHAMWFIALGVAGLVLGFVLNMVTMRRQTKRMMGGMSGMGMGGMGASGSMPDVTQLMAMQRMAGTPTVATGATTEVVKVRCKACSSLEAESAAFCSKCGKPLA